MAALLKQAENKVVYYILRAPAQAFGISPSLVPSAPVRKLNDGDLIEIGEKVGPWYRARLPVEDKIDPMTDKEIEWQSSFVHQDTIMEKSIYQPGQNVAGRFPVDPAHLLLRRIWWLREFQYVPDIFKLPKDYDKKVGDAVVEHFPGKIIGLMKDNTYVIQRGKGNIPERLNAMDWCILARKPRIKRAFYWSYAGFILAAGVGGIHTAITSNKRQNYRTYVGWLVWGGLIVTPCCALGTYAYCQSAFSSLVMTSSMCGLLAHDLFYE